MFVLRCSSRPATTSKRPDLTCRSQPSIWFQLEKMRLTTFLTIPRPTYETDRLTETLCETC